MTDLNTLTCEPIPNVVAHEMLQNISLAICHPAEASPEQAASLTRQLVYTALAFDPRDMNPVGAIQPDQLERLKQPRARGDGGVAQ